MKKLFVTGLVLVCFALTTLMPNIAVASSKWCAGGKNACAIHGTKHKVKRHHAMKSRTRRAKCTCPAKMGKGPKKMMRHHVKKHKMVCPTAKTAPSKSAGMMKKGVAMPQKGTMTMPKKTMPMPKKGTINK